MISLRKLFQQGVKGKPHPHKGRPGKVGGSAPGGREFTPEEKARMRSELGKKKSPDTKAMIDTAGIEMVGGHLNFRQLGERYKFPVTDQGLLDVGEEIDFYDENGDKQYGKIINYSGDKITISMADPDSGRFNGGKYVLQMVNWKTGRVVTK